MTLLTTYTIDGLQMSVKRLTSGGQTCDQEAAVQWIFHLERSSFFYLLDKGVIVQTITLTLVSCSDSLTKKRVLCSERLNSFEDKSRQERIRTGG